MGIDDRRRGVQKRPTADAGDDTPPSVPTALPERGHTTPSPDAGFPTAAGQPPRTPQPADMAIDKASWLKVWLSVEGRQAVAEDFEARAIAAVHDLIARATAGRPDGLSFTVMHIEPTTDAPDDDAMPHA